MNQSINNLFVDVFPGDIYEWLCSFCTTSLTGFSSLVWRTGSTNWRARRLQTSEGEKRLNSRKPRWQTFNPQLEFLNPKPTHPRKTNTHTHKKKEKKHRHTHTQTYIYIYTHTHATKTNNKNAHTHTHIYIYIHTQRETKRSRVEAPRSCTATAWPSRASKTSLDRFCFLCSKGGGGGGGLGLRV